MDTVLEGVNKLSRSTCFRVYGLGAAGPAG